jgi:hypothetical protein
MYSIQKNAERSIETINPYIVVPAEEHQKHTDSRGEKQQTIFCKHVRLEETQAIVGAELMLSLIIIAVQRSPDRSISVQNGAERRNLRSHQSKVIKTYKST